MKKAKTRLKNGLGPDYDKEPLTRLEDSCYTHIDMLPIYFWNKVNDTGDFTYLVKQKNRAAKVESSLPFLWKILLDQYVKQFGFSEDLLRIIRKQKERSFYLERKIATLDDSFQLFIDVCDEELKNMQTPDEKSNFYELKAYIEKGMGMHIDPMRVSVSEFFSYIKLLEKQGKQKGAP